MSLLSRDGEVFRRSGSIGTAASSCRARTGHADTARAPLRRTRSPAVQIRTAPVPRSTQEELEAPATLEAGAQRGRARRTAGAGRSWLSGSTGGPVGARLSGHRSPRLAVDRRPG